MLMDGLNFQRAPGSRNHLEDGFSNGSCHKNLYGCGIAEGQRNQQFADTRKLQAEYFE
jgi:hypothetical protein